MSDVRTLAPRTNLWLWRADAGGWAHCGTSSVDEIRVALAAATQAAAALGLDVRYVAAPDAPAPLHAARRITVELPDATTVDEHGGRTWEGPDYAVSRDDRRGVLSAEAPRFDAITSDEVAAWRSFALAVLAATQPAAVPAGATA